MASKGSTKGADRGAVVAAAAVDRPEKLRNVAVVGHSGSGKTTLVEALLLRHGHDPAGRHGARRHHGVRLRPGRGASSSARSSLSVAPFEHDGIKVNLLDTPGYADFVGELRAGLRAADAALFVVSAVDGVDATTIALWEECAAVGMPRAVVVTRLDHQRADFEESVAVCRRVFGDNVLPLYLPMHGDDGSVGGPDRAALPHRAGLLRRLAWSSGRPDPEHLELIDEPAQRADRGDHRRERGRDADGPLPRRRGHRRSRRSSTTWRPPSRAARSTRCWPSAAPTGLGADALLEVLTSAFPSPLEHDAAAGDRRRRQPRTSR